MKQLKVFSFLKKEDSVVDSDVRLLLEPFKSVCVMEMAGCQAGCCTFGSAACYGWLSILGWLVVDRWKRLASKRTVIDGRFEENTSLRIDNG